VVWSGTNTGPRSRKQRQPKSNRQPTRKQDCVRTSHTHPCTLCPILSQRGHASGRAGRAATGIARRRAQSAYSAAQQGAARGGARHDRRGRAVAACWQQCSKQDAAVDLLRGWLAAAIAFVRGVFASHQVREMCCPCRPLSWPATCSPVLRVVRPHQSRCLFGCACRRAPADNNGLCDVRGARGHAVANAQRMVLDRGQVVEHQRSVHRTAWRDHTPLLSPLRTFIWPPPASILRALRILSPFPLHSRKNPHALSRNSCYFPVLDDPRAETCPLLRRTRFISRVLLWLLDVLVRLTNQCRVCWVCRPRLAPVWVTGD
jgi:hypothetical protein